MAKIQLKIRQLKNSTSLTHKLVESLRTQIIGSNMEPGTKLPTAKEIELQAGVSRSVVREAIAALKAEGLIMSRQGIGVFVCDNAHKKSFEIDQDELNSIEDAVQILELRMAIEVEMSAMAASNRNKQQMTKIWKCLTNFNEQVVAGKDAVKEELDFHLAIADASGNPFFVRFIKYIGSGVIPSREIITKNEKAFNTNNCLELIQQGHHNIALAIENKDIGAAKTAIKDHLGISRRRHIR